MAFGKKTRSPVSSARTIPCYQPVQSVPPYLHLTLIKDRARHAQMQTTTNYLTNPGTHQLHQYGADGSADAPGRSGYCVSV